MKHKPVYRCRVHELSENQHSKGAWQLAITINDPHDTGAPPGSEGWTSSLRSIDFENGVAVTQNSIYVFDPDDLK